MKTLCWICVLSFFSCASVEENNLANANTKEEQKVSDTLNSMNKSKKTYLALGDSYTIGESVDVSGRWPIQLVNSLEQAGVNMQSPKIIAKTGWTTDELMAAIGQEALTDTFDLVSLLIGVNNQYRGYPIAQQKEEFEVLLQQAIQFAGQDTSRVFVVSIPDWGVTPFADGKDRDKISEEIDLYNEVNQVICLKYGVQYFDITPISRNAVNDATLIAEDGLHPSAKMYGLWVEIMSPWVQEILAE